MRDMIHTFGSHAHLPTFLRPPREDQHQKSLLLLLLLMDQKGKQLTHSLFSSKISYQFTFIHFFLLFTSIHYLLLRPFLSFFLLVTFPTKKEMGKKNPFTHVLHPPASSRGRINGLVQTASNELSKWWNSVN